MAAPAGTPYEGIPALLLQDGTNQGETEYVKALANLVAGLHGAAERGYNQQRDLLLALQATAQGLQTEVNTNLNNFMTTMYNMISHGICHWLLLMNIT